VKSGKSIVQNGGHSVLDIVESAVKIIQTSNVALYKVFIFSICV